MADSPLLSVVEHNNWEVSKKTTDFLDRSTWVLAGLLLVLILLSNVALNDNQGTTDSRLLEETTQQPIPEVVPETIPEVPVEDNN